MEGVDGIHVSENATVVIPLTAPTLITQLMKNPKGSLTPFERVLRPQLNCLQQGEDGLSKALLDHYLVPPPRTGLVKEVNKEENWEGTYGGSQILQDQFLDEFIFKGDVKEGFFVEAGADDFLLNTNTLRFELLHGWKGLLVEPVALQFQQG